MIVSNELDPIRAKKGLERYCICKTCGEKYIYRSYKPNVSASYCPNCQKAAREKKKKEDPRDKYEIRFDRAVEKIRDQVKRPWEYDKYIEMARKRLYSYGSIPEAMVAIELLRLGYKIIPQQSIGRYRVDFLIENPKLVIEVDGSLYHKKMTAREGQIQLMLGFEWKIIHIPAELIEKDIRKLQRCIDIYTSNTANGTR